MDTREYIESGTLELYVAGLLSVEEMRDVELKACQYPEIKTELESLQASLEKYAIKYAMQPPAGLKERIMKIVEGEGESERGKTKTIVREISSSQQAFPWYLAAASVVLLIVAGTMAYRYASQVTQYQQQVAQLTDQQSSVLKKLDTTEKSLSKYNEQLTMLTDPNTVRIAMKGTPKSPESLAMIYWNKQSQTVYLDIKNLPPAPPDKQYQLWFIDPSNKPVSAGVFDMQTGEWIKMVNAPSAVAFAVTLEPRGGSVNPTMDQMYVLGTVNS